MRSISVKVTILYIFLASLNISLFTIIIFENQIDLITDNIKYRTREVAGNIYSQLTNITEQIRSNPEKYTQEGTVTETIIAGLKNVLNNYVLFKEDRTILYKTDNQFILNDEHLLDAFRALKNKEFVGQFYFPKIDEKSHEISFYIPFTVRNYENIILLFKMQMKEINKRLLTLYSMVILIICLIAAFHIIFGFILNRLIISPVKILAGKSIEISNGKLSARARLKKKDEFGLLGTAFDKMADSIQDKIRKLDTQNKRMKLELSMAKQVQNSIYPKCKENERFKLAVYHRPLIEVSGDYHDIFSLGKGRYGCLIADVCGHGISAALITMLIKELFENVAHDFTDTKLLLSHINNELGHLMATFDKFFTAFYLVIDNKKKLTFTNAGHQKAYLCRPNPLKIFELDTQGVIIGVSKHLSSMFKSKTVQLRTGDKILLTTDGISDTRNAADEDYSIKRLLSIARQFSRLSCNEMLERILKDFNSFKDDSKRRDDETIMIIEIK